MANWNVVCADVIEWAKTYDGPPFMALLCDPPYSLGNGKRGFMGKAWDGDIAFNPDTWAALAEHLHPGAFGMAFASARGWHRLACAIEDAGLRIHPSVFNWRTGETYEIGMLGWAQGSGFPKATRIDTQVDKAAGAEREEVGRIKDGQPATGIKYQSGRQGQFKSGDNGNGRCDQIITAPATPLAQAWAGHRYGLQAMKPALEPIIVFQVPYSGRPVDSIVETGAGALWVDGGRIGYQGETPSSWFNRETRLNSRQDIYGGGKGLGQDFESDPGKGRWPANLVLTHLPGCERVGVKRVAATSQHGENVKKNVWDGSWKNTSREIRFSGYADPDGRETVADWRCEPECPVRRLGEMTSGIHSAGSKKPPGGWPDTQATWGTYGEGEYSGARYGDTGTAARFYYQASWQYEIAERLADADPVRYVAKAARKERDAGLEGFPEGHNDWDRETCGLNKGPTERYGRGGDTKHLPKRNPHPTIKPIALTRWLATLLLPPDAYAPRRVLIPFAGSGSEMIGAGLVGWEEITGIEFDADTCAIAQARLEHWLENVQMELAL